MPVTSVPMMMSGGLAPSNQKALLHFDGANGATITTDAYRNTVTMQQSTLSSAHPKFGPTGIHMNASGTAVCKITGPTSLGLNGWTLEQWGYWDSLPNPMTVFSATNAANFGVVVYLNTTSTLQAPSIQLSTSGTTNDLSGTATSRQVTTGAQHHIAFTRDPATHKHYLYLDGTAIYGSTNTSTDQICPITKIDVGNDGTNIRNIAGWVDEFRFSNFCRYPGGTTFAPSTVAFTS